MNNSGFKTIGGEKTNSEKEQYIIVGVERGGTSVVAASLHALGITLGENCYVPNYEDIELAKAFRSKNWRSFKKLVTDYESRYPKIAWKLPDSNRNLKRVNKYFSNPYYIFIYRDIFAISNRKNGVHNKDVLLAMESSLAAYKRILKFIKKLSSPSLHLSYEKILLNKKEYAHEITKFCGIAASEALLDKVTDLIEPSPSEYIQWSNQTRQLSALNQSGFDGYIDIVSKDAVSGWMLKKNSDSPIVIELFINDKYITESLCEIQREDLVAASKSSSGKAGFHIPLATGMLNRDAKISIKPKGCAVGLSTIFK